VSITSMISIFVGRSKSTC